MTDWQNALRNRKDQLITGMNQSRREIDRLAATIATIEGNIALDQDELNAVERALTPIPDGRLTREEVARRIEATNAENKLVGMTDERPASPPPPPGWPDKVERTGLDRHGNPIGTKYKPDGFA